MKIYGIKPKEIAINDYSFNGVVLGEKGRGRKEVIVPVAQGDLLEPGLTKAGKPRLNKSTSKDGWVTRISTEGSYVRGANGNVSVHKDSEFSLVAKGYGAFGLAGRTGTWDDVIISVDDNTLVRVKPSRADAYYIWFGTVEATVLSQSEIIAIADLEEAFPNSFEREDFVRV
jgi:hypothetical protein